MTVAIEESIRHLIAAELSVPPDSVPVDTHLHELGLSSIKVLRILARLETLYEIELDDDAVFRAETLRDLACLVAAAPRRASA